jgi:hypothetical protein
VKVIPGQVKAPNTNRSVRYSRRLLEVEVLEGLGTPEELHDELLGYANVILGRADPPNEMDSIMDLMEIAAAYYGRAKEIDMLIHWEEQNRRVIRGSPYNKFRTGQLRSFIEMAKMMADLGSRRLTAERLLYDARYDAGNGS